MLVLDAGFGGGEYLGWLARRLPEASLVGYDTSTGNTYSSNLERARKNADSTNVRLAVRDLKVLDDRSVFDVVYSIDVLEHIPGNETVMRNIFDALKEDGLFYLAMPYDRERPTVLPARYQEKFTAWADEEHVGEMRSLPETEAVLRKIGFTVLESRYTFGFFARLAWELAQYTKALRGGRVFSRAAKPLLNGLATLEFISSKPDDGNVLIVYQK